MRISKQFNPPKREIGEGLLAYSWRCDKAKQRFIEIKSDELNMTREEFIKKYFNENN